MTSESGNKLFGIHSNLHTSIVEHAQNFFKKRKRNDYCDNTNTDRVL